MIDTHCHLTYDGLFERLDVVLAAAAQAGVDRMISIGTGPEDSARAIALAERHPNVFATAGIHPCYAHRHPDVSALRPLLAHPRVVAMGEMGLDGHHGEPAMNVQQERFETQLTLLAEFPDLPAVIHNRSATEPTLAVLRASGLAPQRFLFHCFTGSEAEVERILDFGASVGFTGVVTFKNAQDVQAASDRVPLERLFIETDAPYLTPAPHRKIRTNEPCYVPFVAATLAERRGLDLATFIRQVDTNAERFFRLPPAG